MKTLRRTLNAFALVLPLAGPAGAAVLVAGPLFPAPGEFLLCSIVNVSSRARDVEIDMFSGNGSPAGGTTSPGLLPMHSTILGSIDNGAATCRFTVEGGGKDYRANVCIRTLSTETAVCVPAE